MLASSVDVRAEGVGTSMTSMKAPSPIRVSEALFFETARRLVSQTQADIDQAARRLVAGASGHGIDLSWVHATVERDASGRVVGVRQACLPVPGAGKTAMVFVSEPPADGEIGGAAAARAERAACIRETCAFVARTAGDRVRVAQALPEIRETWASEAFLEAGFLFVGELLYMRRAISARDAGEVEWPEGVDLVGFEALGPERDRILVGLLDETYAETLDCPELCGVRETCDVLESHKKAGVFDAAWWWIVRENRVPRGCILLNRNPDARTVELVYLGLTRGMRGKGLARRLLRLALARLHPRHTGWTLSCAVDRRNAPAVALYESFGMRVFGERTALVRKL